MEIKHYFEGEDRLEFAVHTCVRIETRDPFVERRGIEESAGRWN